MMYFLTKMDGAKILVRLRNNDDIPLVRDLLLREGVVDESFSSDEDLIPMTNMTRDNILGVVEYDLMTNDYTLNLDRRYGSTT